MFEGANWPWFWYFGLCFLVVSDISYLSGLVYFFLCFDFCCCVYMFTGI